jgi:Rab GDP dissociation inhibitor
MAQGNLIKILIHTKVYRYLEFKSIDASFVQAKGKIAKVPATVKEALSSPLMGILEKRRMKKLLEYCQDVTEDKSTWKGKALDTMTMQDLYKEFGLDPNTQSFMGHAMALHRTDEYLSQPALKTVMKFVLYASSVAAHGNSPYLYPLYGLGDLPQAFARLSAVYGGTFMLNKPFEGIEKDDDGRVTGVKSEGVTFKCKTLIADPAYFPEKVTKTGQVVRCYCLLDHDIPVCKGINSGQIIIPQKETGRKNDIYVIWIGKWHEVAAEGKFIALVSTTVETENPEKELEAGLALIGNTVDKFIVVDDIVTPTDDGTSDNIYVSESYDATTHFETTVDDVFKLYSTMNGGKDLVLNTTTEE